jgi:hypothetical protein
MKPVHVHFIYRRKHNFVKTIGSTGCCSDDRRMKLKACLKETKCDREKLDSSGSK